MDLKMKCKSKKISDVILRRTQSLKLNKILILFDWVSKDRINIL